jgi:hypothetical protein
MVSSAEMDLAVYAEHGHVRRRKAFFGVLDRKSAIAWQADAYGTKDAALDRETFFKRLCNSIKPV